LIGASDQHVWRVAAAPDLLWPMINGIATPGKPNLRRGLVNSLQSVRL